MTSPMAIAMMVILTIFYLALVVNWQHVRRPKIFLLGCAAIILSVFLTGIFSPRKEWAVVLFKIFNTIFTVVAFGCAILTCYKAELPMNIPGTEIENDSEGAA